MTGAFQLYILDNVIKMIWLSHYCTNKYQSKTMTYTHMHFVFSYCIIEIKRKLFIK